MAGSPVLRRTLRELDKLRANDNQIITPAQAKVADDDQAFTIHRATRDALQTEHDGKNEEKLAVKVQLRRVVPTLVQNHNEWIVSLVSKIQQPRGSRTLTGLPDPHAASPVRYDRHYVLG